MSPTARRRALRAAAAVAAISLAGCGPRKTPTPTAAEAAPSDSEGGETVASTDEPADFETCLTEVEAMVSDETTKLPEEARECCSTIAEHFDASGLSFMGEWDTRGQCCDLLEWRGTSACTPWGPPTPPSFRRRVVA